MIPLFTKKAYKPSVSSFQLLYCVYWLQCFQWLPPYIDCNVLNDVLLLRTTIFTLTDYFKWVSCFKSNIVNNDSSLYWDKVINQAFLLFNYCTLYINFSVFNDSPTYIDCNVLNDIVFVISAIFTLTDYFKWVSSFKSNIVKNDSSLLRRKLINQAFLLFNYCTVYIDFSVFNDCFLTLTVISQWCSSFEDYYIYTDWLFQMSILFQIQYC